MLVFGKRTSLRISLRANSNRIAPAEVEQKQFLPERFDLTPVETLQKLVQTGLKKAHRDSGVVFVSSIAGGCFLTVGGALLLKVGGGTLALTSTLPGLHALLCGFIFPIGLVMIVTSGMDLVTSNMMFATLPFLIKDPKRSPEAAKTLLSDCLRLLGVSYSGNLIASVAMASVFAALYGTGGVATFAASIAVAKTGNPFFIALLKGVLANWLVNIAILMSATTNNYMAKIVLIWLPICAFVTLGLEHCVANMFLIPFAIFSGAPVTWSTFFVCNLLPVTLGNYVGAAFMVSFLHSKALIGGVNPKVE